jgi:hypothetical protein
MTACDNLFGPLGDLFLEVLKDFPAELGRRLSVTDATLVVIMYVVMFVPDFWNLVINYCNE